MSETSYEQCHISYRGYMDKEIDTAREVLRKYGKPCVDAVKELRSETDMPMSECANMLRCLWRDAEIEHVKSENAKLRELVRAAWRCIHTGASCSDCRLIAGGCTLQTAMRELGVEVDA